MVGFFPHGNMLGGREGEGGKKGEHIQKKNSKKKNKKNNVDVYAGY